MGNIKRKPISILQKRVPMPAYIITVLFLLIFLVYATITMGERTFYYTINGLYQSVDTKYVYNAQFYGDEFVISRYIILEYDGSEDTVLAGEYRHIEGNTFLLLDQKGTGQEIVTLEDKGFYFLDDEMQLCIFFIKIT